MKDRLSDIHVTANVTLPSPEELLRDIPSGEKDAAFMLRSREEVRRSIFGENGKFLVVAGPCSIHDVDAGLEYAHRLAGLAAQVKERMTLVMRVYFEKPRTTVGWKGLIMDPRLDGSNDIAEGLAEARRFLLQVMRMGVGTSTELLDPITPQYIADLISWSAIGARTTESQTHRQMASGLSMPMGFKNGTMGNLEPALNAIKAAMQPQTFLGVGMDGRASAVTTSGNPDCHVILRGGECGPNYQSSAVAETRALLEKHKLPAVIMIDASHANCSKNHELMPEVFRDIVRQRAAGDRSVIGAMLESHLVAGAQKFPQQKSDLVYGQSITDPCIDWKTTEDLILRSADALGDAC
jgi:3-deoxy-7-phosphoheptulonate synthase